MSRFNIRLLTGLLLVTLAVSQSTFAQSVQAKKSQPSTSEAIYNKQVTFPGPNGLTLSGRLYKPAGKGPFPAVVFLHGCGGLLNNSGNIGSQFDYWGKKMVNETFYTALFVDSFTPRGVMDGVCGTEGQIVNEVTDRRKDAYAGLNYLKTLSYVRPQKVALVGWSNGGSAALSTVAKNNNPDLPANGGFINATAIYPGCGLLGAFGNYNYANTGTYLPAVSTLILAGGSDTTVPPTPKCVNLVDQAKKLGASNATGNPIDLTIYPGAQHGFDRAVEGDSSWTTADLQARDAERATLVQRLKAAFGV